MLHLTGSVVSEFHCDLSRLYAQDCPRAVTGALPGYEHVLAYLSPDRSWRFPVTLNEDDVAAPPRLSLDHALALIEGLGVDVTVPQMFCVPGMTHYRALFDVLGIPYVGNPPAAMALSTNKALARAVVAAAGVAVPAGELIGRGELPRLHPPVVIKPVDADNSDGVSLVREHTQMGPAVTTASRFSEQVLVERSAERSAAVSSGRTASSSGCRWRSTQ